jgi:hypothetical protein
MLTSYAGRHASKRRGRRSVVVIGVVLALVLLAGILMAVLSAPPAQPATPDRVTLASSTETVGQRLLDKAETRTGDWYFYGGAGPSAFDCSGLVYWAAGQIGLKNWPRSTYDLLSTGVSSGRLVRTWNPQRGDLAFYGSGHVEINTVWYHVTFGAQTWGTRVGWHHWGGWWAPTAFYRIRW